MRRRHWIVSAVVILLVIYAARKVDWPAAGSILSHAALAPLAAAIAVNVLSLALRGVGWWIFLRRIGVNSLALAIRGEIVGAGFNNLLVANGGDAARALLVARASGATRTSVLATLALARLFDPLCFGLLLFVATFVIPLPPQLSAADRERLFDCARCAQRAHVRSARAGRGHRILRARECACRRAAPRRHGRAGRGDHGLVGPTASW